MSLPNEVWQGLFGRYRDLMLPTTEAPECYHYATFATVFGVALSRSLCVVYVNPLYPNFYVCLVGRTGLPRKGTATSRGLALLRQISEIAKTLNPKSNLPDVITGLGSGEGLVDALDGTEKVVLVAEEEFRSILVKGLQSGNTTIPKLTVLYDCRDKETLKTRTNPIEANLPFVSLITGTTQVWLQEYFQKGDIEGGFGNRFLYVMGEPSSPKPFPTSVDSDGLKKLAEDIAEVRKWTEQQKVLLVSEEAKEVFEAYYLAQYERSKSDDFTAVLSRRMPAYAWKLALLYAAQEQSPKIKKHHMEPALLAVEFFEESILPVFAGYGQSRTKKLEDKIIARLRESPDNKMKTRDLQRIFGDSVADLERVSTNLAKAGVLVEYYEKLPSGQRAKFWKLLEDN